MRESFMKFIAAAGTAIYSHCDERFQHLPEVVQVVLRQQKNATLFVFQKMSDLSVEVVNAAKTQHQLSPTDIVTHGKHALTALPNFLAYCVTDSKAPRIFYISKRLVVDDFLPVFLAVYFYQLAQYAYQSNKENIPESARYCLESVALFFTTALFVFSSLRKLQFYARTSVLSLEFPKAFHRMHNTVEIDNAVCASSCNALRFITGDIRSVLLYSARLSGLGLSAWQFPALSWLLFPFQILFAGQMIAEYHYASANVCERHRWINYKEYLELFLALGLLYQLGTSGLAFVASQFTAFLSMQFERHVGNVFMLSPMLQVLANLPREIYEPFFAGILMFYLIGLTYYMPFPNPVKETQRGFFDFGLRWLTETMMDFSIFSFKKMLKHRDESSGRLTFRQRLESVYQWIDWFCKKTDNNLRVASFLQHQHMKAVTYFVLPTMLHSRVGALTDPVLVLYTPRIFADIKNILRSISSFHPIVLKVVHMCKELDSIFSRSAVKWTLKGLSFFIPSVGFVLPKMGEVLTVDFIMNKAPKYLADLLSVCNWLHDNKIIDNVFYDKYVKELRRFEKNITLLKKVLNELPKSVIDDFVAWIGTEECRAWITKCLVTLNTLNDHLMADNNKKLEQLGFAYIDYEQVEQCEYDMPSEESVRRCSEEAKARISAADSCLFPAEVTTTWVAAGLEAREQERPSGDWDECESDVACASDDDSVVVSNHRLQAARSKTGRTAWSAGVFSSSRKVSADFEPSAKTAYQFGV